MSVNVLVFGRKKFLTWFKRRYTDPESKALTRKLFRFADVRLIEEYNKYSILLFNFVLVDTSAITSIAQIDYFMNNFSGAEIYLIGQQEPIHVSKLLKTKKYSSICRHVSPLHVVAQIIKYSLDHSS